MTQDKRYAIAVEPKAAYLADESDPAQDKYVFSYTIKITNAGDVGVTLVGRHWIITDADHKVREVDGLGVVGQQPELKPGESFEYTSGASLTTAVGTMRGTYRLRADDGTTFEAPIPPFTLSIPRTLH
ncbi:MAG: Co2+/Mg2+ efflux protein ApaG [Burkholderiales bacterium]|nr:Co2+/Mg2+ efflux protein ApaG [Burkholderiales bacterium]